MGISIQCFSVPSFRGFSGSEKGANRKTNSHRIASGAASDRVKPPLEYLEVHSNKNIAPRRMFFLKKVVILNILINFAMKKPY